MNSIRGSAILITLLLIGLIQILLISVFFIHRIELHQTQALKDHSQNVQILLGAQAWSIERIQHNIHQGKNVLVYTFPKHQVLQKNVENYLFDLQSKVNLNALTSSNFEGYQYFFRQLLPHSQPDFIKNWLNVLKEQLALNQEITDFTSSSNQRDDLSSLFEPKVDFEANELVSVTELLAQGVIDPLRFKSLNHYLTVLPGKTKLNINTASPFSWLVLEANLTIEQANRIVQLVQTQGPFSSVDEFLKQEAIIPYELNPASLTVLSEYYLSVSKIIDNETSLVLYSLIHGRQRESSVELSVLWQSFGTI